MAFSPGTRIPGHRHGTDINNVDVPKPGEKHTEGQAYTMLQDQQKSGSSKPTPILAHRKHPTSSTKKSKVQKGVPVSFPVPGNTTTASYQGPPRLYSKSSAAPLHARPWIWRGYFGCTRCLALGALQRLPHSETTPVQSARVAPSKKTTGTLLPPQLHPQDPHTLLLTEAPHRIPHPHCTSRYMNGPR